MQPASALIFDLQTSRWLLFTEAQHIIRAISLDEVLPALDEAARLVDGQGLWAAGLLSYEAGPAFDPAMETHPPGHLPLLWLGLFNDPQPVDPPPAGAAPDLRWQPDLTRAQYDARIAAIKDRIACGDTYQVNFTMRMRAGFDGDPAGLFGTLVRAQGTGPAAMLRTGRFDICSASPELFFTLDGEHLVSRPMKGTGPRGRTPEEDAANMRRLHGSEKDRAENLMIVDMVRNDMGRIAATGSVQVDRLFEVERYPTLLQMTSTVSCRTGAGIPGIFSALFPCASITGAPKISTMGIIRELESGPRGVYTGAIGFWGPGRRAQFNVAIRTAVFDRETRRLEYGTGSGIVWDSSTGAEYEEALLKTRVITAPPPDFELLETMRWSAQEGIFLLERHLDRLRSSAGHFCFPFNEEGVRRALGAVELDGPGRLRLLVARDGTFRLESARLGEPPVRFADLLRPVRGDAATRRAALAGDPVDTLDAGLYHKTTRRTVYEDALAALPEGVEDALLWNDAGEATEFTTSNLVAEIDGRLVTPPVEAGLLPGTLRAELLESGVIQEGEIRVEALGAAERIWAINSVRGWWGVELIEHG